MLQKIEVDELMNIEILDKYVAIKAILAGCSEQFSGAIIRQSIIAGDRCITLQRGNSSESLKLNAIQEAFLVVYT